MRLLKLEGTYLCCWSKEISWFGKVKGKSAWKTIPRHKCSPRWSAWSDTWAMWNRQSSIPAPPESWDSWEMSLTGLLCPGGGQKCAPSVQGKSLTVLWQWEDAFSTFPACYLNPPSTSLLFLFSTLRWQTVQRFSWVYHKEWKYKGTREPNKCCIECVMNNIRLIWIWALFSVVWWRCLWMLVSKYIQVFWDIIP